MKFLLVSVFSLSAIVGFAQQSPALKLSRENRLNNLSLNKPIDNMPSANVGPSGQLFLYNNGNGLNIYKSQPDDMPVAKPDGTYKDEMCPKGKLDMQKVIDAVKSHKANQFQPEGNSKFNFVFPLQKDSTAFVDSVKTLQLKPKF
jgi:hypothetical protein